MTIAETLKTMQFLKDETHEFFMKCAYDTAIEALEKQVPMKPLTVSEKRPNGRRKFLCPRCESKMLEIHDRFYFGQEQAYCENCGQKIDWNFCKHCGAEPDCGEEE